MNIGTTLKKARETKSLRQGFVAKEMKISQTYLSLIETEKRIPSTQLIEKFAKYYEIPMEVILWFSITEQTVHPNKMESFKQIKPAIDALIVDFLNNK